MKNVFKWNILMNNPYVSEFLGWKLIEKSGMAEELKAFMQQRQMTQQQGVVSPMTPTAQKRAVGETETPMGFNMIDTAINQGQKTPPAPYTRGR